MLQEPFLLDCHEDIHNYVHWRLIRMSLEAFSNAATVMSHRPVISYPIKALDFNLLVNQFVPCSPNTVVCISDEASHSTKISDQGP